MEPSHRAADLKFQGISLGSHVDHEVSLLVKLLACYEIPLAPVLDSSREYPDHLPSRVVDLLRGARRWVHPYTLAALSALQANGLRPVDSQVVCADKRHEIGTMVDVVCYREVQKTKQIVLVELKCGFDNYHESYITMMQPPFEQKYEIGRAHV